MINLLDNARYLMDRVEEAATRQGVVLPGRRFVTLGGAVYDCEEVVVSPMTTNTGLVDPTADPAATMGPCNVIWSTTYELAIVLNSQEALYMNQEAAPPVAAIEQDAAAISAATDVLVEALALVTDRGDLGRISATVTYGQPQGGLVAAVAEVRANNWI